MLKPEALGLHRGPGDRQTRNHHPRDGLPRHGGRRRGIQAEGVAGYVHVLTRAVRQRDHRAEIEEKLGPSVTGRIYQLVAERELPESYDRAASRGSGQVGHGSSAPTPSPRAC